MLIGNQNMTKFNPTKIKNVFDCFDYFRPTVTFVWNCAEGSGAISTRLICFLWYLWSSKKEALGNFWLLWLKISPPRSSNWSLVSKKQLKTERLSYWLKRSKMFFKWNIFAIQNRFSKIFFEALYTTDVTFDHYNRPTEIHHCTITGIDF